MDYATAPRGELVRLIYEQQAQLEILKGIIAQLQEQLKQRDPSDDTAKTVPGFVKANVKKKKRKKPGKQRAHGFARKKETPTQTVFHSLAVCPSCESDQLGEPQVCYSRQIIDIPIVRYDVIEHVVLKRYCFCCGKMVTPQVDFSSDVVGKGRIGINLMAKIFTMREEEDMTIHKIQDHFQTMYDLWLSVGEIVDILHQEATLGTPEVEQIKHHLLASNVIYADETGGREDGKNGYNWSFSNRRYHLLLYRKSRAAKVVAEVLGKDGEKFNGVLSSDFYTGYNEYAGPHQRCWVHYNRDLDKLIQEHPKDRKLKRWGKQIYSLYHEAKAYSGPAPNLAIGIKDEERRQKEQEFKDKLKKLCEPYVKTTAPQATLAGRAIRYLSEMFTFVHYEGVESDNNPAERAVRKTVIKRKIFYGTRSPKGSETRSLLGSLSGTWRLQNLNPFQQMRLLLLKASNQQV